MFVYLEFLFYNLVIIMTFSRGLVISLGVSALGCTLLFLYFRNRMVHIENKVNVMFDLIQNHQTSNQPVGYNNQQNWEVKENNESNQAEKDDTDLIEISDDEQEYDSQSDDSLEVSDNEEEDEPKTISLENAEQIILDTNDVKKIVVPLSNDNSVPQPMAELEEVTDSLDEFEDEINDEEEDEEQEEENNESDKHNSDIDSIKKIQTVESDSGKEIEEFNYQKLRVADLKALCFQKGLTNYKSLKKQPLIELLKSQE